MKKIFIDILKSNKSIMSIVAFIYSLFSIICIRGKNGNSLILKTSFLKNTKIRILGKNNTIIIHPENRLNNCLLHIYGNNCKIVIGKHCVLLNVELWIEDNGGEIKIGYHTTMEGGHIAATEGRSIFIGEDCMFSHRIEIRNGDSHAIFDLQSDSRINNARNITISDHVWLGADVKVLKGADIGTNAIIGTGSIITGKVEPNSIYVGSPAKKVKSSIYWTRNR